MNDQVIVSPARVQRAFGIRDKRTVRYGQMVGLDMLLALEIQRRHSFCSSETLAMSQRIAYCRTNVLWSWVHFQSLSIINVERYSHTNPASIP
ncbi:MAG: hypothetical protein OXC95_11030, partial [Dehalococcoidia bacterium]|nr:hypothetical protein [Dehalococcoidia bacterium]